MEPWFPETREASFKKRNSLRIRRKRADTNLSFSRDCPYLWATAKPIVPTLSKDVLFYLNEDRMSLEAIKIFGKRILNSMENMDKLSIDQ